MLDITPFPNAEFAALFRWNHGDADGWDWLEFERQMLSEAWTHQAVWRDGQKIGCVSLELLDAVTVSYHLAFERGSVKRFYELRRILVGIGIALFQGGVQRLEAHVPNGKDAAACIAQYCGFYLLRREDGKTVYGMTAHDYFNDPARWDGMI